MRQLQEADDTALNLVERTGRKCAPMVVRLWWIVPRKVDKTGRAISKHRSARSAGSRGERGWSQGLTT